MNKKNTDLLEYIFRDPAPSNIQWKDIEELLKFLGAKVLDGDGYDITVYLNNVKAIINRHHNRGIEADARTVVEVRKLLADAGIKPL